MRMKVSVIMEAKTDNPLEAVQAIEDYLNISKTEVVNSSGCKVRIDDFNIEGILKDDHEDSF
jgi:hypothetical protein